MVVENLWEKVRFEGRYIAHEVLDVDIFLSLVFAFVDEGVCWIMLSVEFEAYLGLGWSK